jgi:hypothetical protein
MAINPLLTEQSMDTPVHDNPKSKPIPSQTVPIRIHKTTLRQLKSLLQTCNRKSHGKRVKPSDLISKALTLINESHIEEIQKSTYTSEDQLEIEFKKYCSTNGSISKDQFLKIILSKALDQ